MPELETVDVPGVEILSAGGPVHGVGSPPEGDFWSKDELEAIAAANRELAGELQVPQKIGHSAAQLLLANSGLKAPTPGEMPAVGWLDGSTFRVEDRDGVAKLLADGKDVPAKFAELLKKKAYRTRSVELSKVESQEILVDGKAKVFEWVVTGLAWLGAKLPAVRTLDDIVALYEHEELDKPDARVFVVYATGDVVWDPDLGGYQDLRDRISQALNGAPTGGMIEPRFWVADVAMTQDKALVQDYYGDGDDGYVVPFTVNDDSSVTIAPSSDWTQVEQGWVEAARELAAHADASDRSRRHSPRMPETTKYTDEQRRKFADAIPGDTLKVEDVTDEMLSAAGVNVVEEKPAEDDPAKALEADERFRKLEADTASANERAEKLEKQLEAKDRDMFIESVLRDGKAEPGQKDAIVTMYDEAPAATRKFYENAPVNEQWAREYGADSDEILDDEQAEAQDKAYEAWAAEHLDIAGPVI